MNYHIPLMRVLKKEKRKKNKGQFNFDETLIYAALHGKKSAFSEIYNQAVNAKISSQGRRSQVP